MVAAELATGSRVSLVSVLAAVEHEVFRCAQDDRGF